MGKIIHPQATIFRFGNSQLLRFLVVCQTVCRPKCGLRKTTRAAVGVEIQAGDCIVNIENPHAKIIAPRAVDLQCCFLLFAVCGRSFFSGQSIPRRVGRLFGSVAGRKPPMRLGTGRNAEPFPRARCLYSPIANSGLECARELKSRTVRAQRCSTKSVPGRAISNGHPARDRVPADGR